jgi:hypothetical protein
MAGCTNPAFTRAVKPENKFGGIRMIEVKGRHFVESSEKWEDVADLTGRHVLLQEHTMSPEYQAPEWRVVHVTGGFGAKVGRVGNALFATHVKDDDHVRYSRQDIELLLTEVTVEVALAKQIVQEEQRAEIAQALEVELDEEEHYLWLNAEQRRIADKMYDAANKVAKEHGIKLAYNDIAENFVKAICKYIKESEAYYSERNN